MSYDLFDLVLKSWDRPMREVSGYKVIPYDGGWKLVLNTLGIKPDDINVKIDRHVLTIEGKTESESIHFTNSVNYKFNIESIKSELVKVDYEVADGLTIVDLIVNKDPENEIEISRK